MNKRLLSVLQSMPIQDATWIDCYNNIYDDKVAGTLRTTINSSNMFFIMETKKKEPFIVASRGREPQVMSPKRTDYGKAIRKDYESHAVTEKRKYMQKLEPREDGISNTLTSVQKDNYVAEPNEHNYRIRKLTPRECFRLMDVDDADIDKLLEAKIPNTQLYKLAGNSIVVAVLERIFDKMFVNTEITDWTLF